MRPGPLGCWFSLCVVVCQAQARSSAPAMDSWSCVAEDGVRGGFNGQDVKVLYETPPRGLRDVWSYDAGEGTVTRKHGSARLRAFTPTRSCPFPPENLLPDRISVCFLEGKGRVVIHDSWKASNLPPPAAVPWRGYTIFFLQNYAPSPMPAPAVEPESITATVAVTFGYRKGGPRDRAKDLQMPVNVALPNSSDPHMTGNVQRVMGLLQLTGRPLPESPSHADWEHVP